MKIIDTTNKISIIKKSNGDFIKTESGTFWSLSIAPKREEGSTFTNSEHIMFREYKVQVSNIYYIVDSQTKLEFYNRIDFVTPKFDKHKNCIGFNEFDINCLS